MLFSHQLWYQIRELTGLASSLSSPFFPPLLLLLNVEDKRVTALISLFNQRERLPTYLLILSLMAILPH